MHWYLTVLKKYAVFTGRSRRKEYWVFLLFNIIIFFILSLIDNTIGTFNAQTGVGVLSSIYWLAILIPSIAVGIRRLHDTGRTGWWLLLVFIPIIGPLRSEEHTSELQSRGHLVCRLLLEKKKQN